MGDSRASHVWLRSTLCCVSSTVNPFGGFTIQISGISGPARPGGPGSSQAQTKKNRKGSSISRSWCQEKKNEVRQQILCQFWDLSNLEQKKSQEELDESPYKYYKCSSMAGSLWIPDLSVSSNLGFRPGQVYPRNSSSNLSWRLPTNKTGLQPGMWEVFFPKGPSGCAQ